MLSNRVHVLRHLVGVIALCSLSLFSVQGARADADIIGRQVASLWASTPQAAPTHGWADVTDLYALRATPGLQARLNAWGVGLEELNHLVDRMSESERRRLARAWHGLAKSTTESTHTDATAMYLSLLAHMRDAKLFASNVSTRL